MNNSLVKILGFGYFQRLAKVLSFVSVGASLAFGGQAMAEDSSEQLPYNGSFELETTGADGSGHIVPEGWGFYSPTGKHEGAYVEGSEMAHSGNRAVSIKATDDATLKDQAMWLSELFEVKPGVLYSINAWIKTQGVPEGAEGGGAWLWIFGYKEMGAEDSFSPGHGTPVQYITGTQDWMEWSSEILISKDIRWMRIAFRVDGKGEAWCDDVTVSKIE